MEFIFLNKMEEFLDKYEISKKEIGRGGSGKVYKILEKQTGKEYALKIIDKSKDFRPNEILIQSKLKHPNILSIIDSSENEKNIFLVLELCGKNLYDYLREKKYIQEEEAIDILYQIATAVKYLHENGIAHRDIKLENIIKCGNLWKLADFGFSEYNKLFTEPVGTLDYLAPEIVARENYFGFPVDVWTLGILLYELLYSSPPFQKRTYMQTYDAIKYDPPVFSKKRPIQKLITSMLNKNPKERIHIEQVLKMIKELRLR